MCASGNNDGSEETVAACEVTARGSEWAGQWATRGEA